MSAIIIYLLTYFNYIQLWAASIDGLRPTWQPAIIYTVLSTMYISSLANKIVVVVVNSLVHTGVEVDDESATKCNRRLCVAVDVLSPGPMWTSHYAAA